jgi:hypothetical protein
MSDSKITNNYPRTLQSIYDGAVKGDFSSNDSKVKVGTQIGVGFIPIVGQFADARDTFSALRDVKNNKSGSWSNLGFSLVGWIPAVGDFAKSAHKVGLKNTFNSMSEVFQSFKNSWTSIRNSDDVRSGKFENLFYKPSTDMRSQDLENYSHGVTNRYGDIEINNKLSDKDRYLTLDHENVHSFFSPKFQYGQKIRSDIGLTGYAESHFLRRVEEGLAEAWAGFKNEGFSGISRGWKFPLENDYGIDPDRFNIERNVLLGIGSSFIGGGSELINTINENE